MKGAETVGSGIRYPMAISVTLQEAEHDVTTKSSEFVDGARIAYTPEQIYYISLGAETNDWDMQISAKYNDEYFNKGYTYCLKQRVLGFMISEAEWT